MKIKYLLFFIVLFVQLKPFAQQEKYSRVKIILTDDNNIQKLGELGLEIDHGIHEVNHYFISEFSASELQKISNADFEFQILVDDIVSDFLKKNQNLLKKNSKRSTDNSCYKITDYRTPKNFSLGSMGGYFTFNEMNEHLDKMMELYPNLLTEKLEIGKSIEGVSIYCYKISTSKDNTSTKVLYNSLIHTREPASLSQLIYFMWYLLENYSTDPGVKKIIESTQLYFVPCVNPDGYIFNEKTNPDGGGMWRKNRRKVGSSYGIDLNRNFGFKWGIDDFGSSPYEQYDTYRGTNAFSEPETDALRNLCVKHNFKLILNHHTFANTLNTPWGFSQSEILPDKRNYEEFSKILTFENNFKYGTTYENLNYLVNGSANDWMYGDTINKKRCYSFNPEVGSEYLGFWPPSNEIIDICNSTVHLNLRAAQIANTLLQFNDLSSSMLEKKSGFLSYQTIRQGLNELGNYELTFTPIKNIDFKVKKLNYNNLNLFSINKDSIDYSLNSKIKYGDTIVYVYEINSDSYYLKDTILKYFGKPSFIVDEAGDNISNWLTTNWGVQEDKYITDSPNTNYSSKITNYITYNKEIDLTKANLSVLSFKAKWNINDRNDNVQLQISEDNKVSWKAICGNYSTKNYYTTNTPVYQGNISEWITEQITLKNYVGKKIHIRFGIFSDEANNNDGFYFYDFKIKNLNKPENCFDSLIIKSDTIYSSSKTGNFEWFDCKSNALVFSSDTINYFLPSKNGQFKTYNNNGICSDTTKCIHYQTTSLNDQNIIFLLDISPNPFNEKSILKVQTFETTNFKVDLINTLGNKINLINEQILESGNKEFSLSASELNLTNGLYILNISINNIVHTRKLLVID